MVSLGVFVCACVRVCLLVCLFDDNETIKYSQKIYKNIDGGNKRKNKSTNRRSPTKETGGEIDEGRRAGIVEEGKRYCKGGTRKGKPELISTR